MSNPRRKYVIGLTEEERASLGELMRGDRVAGYKRKHAEILLKADQGEFGPAWTDARIAEAFDVRLGTVHDIRKRFVEISLEAAVGRKRLSIRNIAEVEFAALTKQCTGRRIGDIESLRSEVRAWENARNAVQVGVDWQFTTADARVKLKRLYPQIVCV